MVEEMEIDDGEEKGSAIVLCLGVPPGVEIGIDMTIWQGATLLIYKVYIVISTFLQIFNTSLFANILCLQLHIIFLCVYSSHLSLSS